MRPFITEGKALEAQELQSGDLELSGYAVVWAGLDASGENFLRGALGKAIPGFLSGPASLAYHHQTGTVLGKVLSLEEDDYGVKLRARVDRQEPGSPLLHLFTAVKRGTLKGLSLGGYFSRGGRGMGKMISDVLRISEVSITGVPQHPLTAAQAVEVKAMMGEDRLTRLRRDVAAVEHACASADVLALRLAAYDAKLGRRTR